MNSKLNAPCKLQTVKRFVFCRYTFADLNLRSSGIKKAASVKLPLYNLNNNLKRILTRLYLYTYPLHGS